LSDYHLETFMINLPLPQPYLRCSGDVTAAPQAKTACGLRDWARESCVGEYALLALTVTTDLPPVTPAQAPAQGARSPVPGVAPSGGVIAADWGPALVDALEPNRFVIRSAL
jgi:hypothetical protein